MSTILASLLGLFGAALPKVFAIFQDKKDKAHELELIRLQIQRDKELGVQNTNAIELQGDAQILVKALDTLKTGIRWVDALSGTVKPVVTYLLVLTYVFNKFYYNYAWTSFDSDLLAIILGFWFGNRMLQRK